MQSEFFFFFQNFFRLKNSRRPSGFCVLSQWHQNLFHCKFLLQDFYKKKKMKFSYLKKLLKIKRLYILVIISWDDSIIFLFWFVWWCEIWVDQIRTLTKIKENIRFRCIYLLSIKPYKTNLFNSIIIPRVREKFWMTRNWLKINQ